MSEPKKLKRFHTAEELSEPKKPKRLHTVEEHGGFVDPNRRCAYCQLNFLGRPYVVQCDFKRLIFCSPICYEFLVEYEESLEFWMPPIEKRYATVVNTK